jgi:hypothetical protein
MADSDRFVSAKPALAFLDQRVAGLVSGMQTSEARTAAAKAFATVPKVQIGTGFPALDRRDNGTYFKGREP